MGQVLHGGATTTEAIRQAIQASLRTLAQRYEINQKTVANGRSAPRSPTCRPGMLSIFPVSATNCRSAALNIVMDRVWFHPPVPICFPDWAGTTIHVGNVAQATDILLRLWPVESGQKHRIAREVCLAALEDPAKTGIARQAFHEAAEEAGMLVIER